MPSSYFKEFSRGDIRYKTGSLPITTGRVHFGNGSGLVKLLRQGVAGFHRGTKEGLISFNKPIPRAGAADDFDQLIDQQSTVTVTGVISDALAYEVEGIMQGVDYSMSEPSMVGGDYAVAGRPTRVKL